MYREATDSWCAVRRAGTGKCTAVFDMEGYSSPSTVMPAFHVRRAACAS
jgi:hypothetical protein